MIYHLLIDVAMGFYARYQITKTICHKNMSIHTSFSVYKKYLKITSFELLKMMYEYPWIYIWMNVCTNMFFAGSGSSAGIGNNFE